MTMGGYGLVAIIRRQQLNLVVLAAWVQFLLATLDFFLSAGFPLMGIFIYSSPAAAYNICPVE